VGDKAAGRQIFDKLLVINPAAEINPMIFPPSLVKAFKQERQKLGREAKGSLDLASTPAGAAVWVDGRPQGFTPRHLTGLTPGTHMVRMARLGYRSAGGLVAVPAGGQHRYAQTLVGLAGAERLRFLANRLAKAVERDRYPTAVDEALRWAKADRLFFLIVQALPETIRIEGYYFDGLASQRLEARRVDLASSASDFDARAEAFFKGLYQENVPARPADLTWVDLDTDPDRAAMPGGEPAPSPGGEEPDRDESIWTSWWFWTVVGVVVVGGAGVALGLTLGTGEQPNTGDVTFRF